MRDSASAHQQSARNVSRTVGATARPRSTAKKPQLRETDDEEEEEEEENESEDIESEVCQESAMR